MAVAEKMMFEKITIHGAFMTLVEYLLWSIYFAFFCSPTWDPKNPMGYMMEMDFVKMGLFFCTVQVNLILLAISCMPLKSRRYIGYFILWNWIMVSLKVMALLVVPVWLGGVDQMTAESMKKGHLKMVFPQEARDFLNAAAYLVVASSAMDMIKISLYYMYYKELGGELRFNLLGDEECVRLPENETEGAGKKEEMEGNSDGNSPFLPKGNKGAKSLIDQGPSEFFRAFAPPTYAEAISGYDGGA